MKSYIALFEIIAFKSFVNNNRLDSKIRSFSQFKSSVEAAFNEHKAEFDDDRGNFKLHLNFSGRYVVLWSDDTTPRSFGDIILFCQSLVMISLVEGFPVRGCIHSGEGPTAISDPEKQMSMALATSLSRGIIQAIDAAEIAPCCCCLLTNSALADFENSRTKNTVTMQDFIRCEMVAEMTVEELNQPILAVNWLSGINIDLPLEMVASFFSMHGKEIDKETELMILNTKAFINSIQAAKMN